MKKLVSLLLVLSMILVIVSGCSTTQDKEADLPDNSGKEQEVSEETQGDAADENATEDEAVEEVTMDLGGRTIRLAAWWDPTPVAGTSESTDLLIERRNAMEEKYNFKMEYLNIPIEQLVETFSASVLAGDPFTELCYLQSQQFFPGLVNNGFCYPVSDLGVFDFEEEKWNKFILEVGTYDGKIYGFDTGHIEPRSGIFWNKTLFEREGLPNLYELQNSYQWTWDKLKECAEKATKDTDGDGVLDQFGLVGDFRLVWAFIESNNGKLYKMIDNKPVFTLNEPEAIEALQFVQDLIFSKALPVPPDGSSWEWPIIEFQSGKYAMIGGEWWQAGRYQESMEDDYGFVVYPMGPRADQYVQVTVQANLIVMPNGVKNPEEVAFIWDEYTDPLPNEDPDSWKQSIENNSRDIETVNTIEKIITGEVKSVMCQMYLVGSVGDLGWNTIRFIGKGDKTPQVAVEEIALQAQAALNEAFNIE